MTHPDVRPADGRPFGSAAFPRRRFLGVAATVVLGACSGGGHSGVPDLRRTIGASPATSTSTTAPTTTVDATPPGDAVDLLILRTASSIEHYAAGVYTQLAGSGLVTTTGISDAMRLFADHHSTHGGIFEGATGRAGGTAFTEANPVLSQLVESRLRAARTEADAVTIAYGVETLAAATFAANASQLTDPGLVPLMTGIGATEARHLTVLGTYLGGLGAGAGTTPPFPTTGFLDVTAAVTPGVGL
jgi:rubrerythrin